MEVGHTTRTTVFNGISVFGDTLPSNTNFIMYKTAVNIDTGNTFYFMYTAYDGAPYTTRFFLCLFNPRIALSQHIFF